MHSFERIEKRIEKLYENIEEFKKESRQSAHKAQDRESKTIQPKENVRGTKGKITIENYIGGRYYFTCDEVEIHKNTIRLIEAKHGKNSFPKIDDVKDALLKMILYTNLEKIYYDDKEYKPIPVLKLTTDSCHFCIPNYYNILLKESETNGFLVETGN
ncbi:hypothetical protein [Fervidobacterium sp.]|uniref:hypothetical protein n=1 Tax=Fervidobacterium sp. TaxID=1871331 RepID=UPI0030D7A9D5